MSTRTDWYHKKELEAALKEDGDWVALTTIYKPDFKKGEKFRIVFVNGVEVRGK